MAAVVSTPVKTAARALLAHTQHTSGLMTYGSEVNCADWAFARIFVSLGRSVATALTNQILFKLQASAAASGDDEWFDVYQFTSGTATTACNAPTLNGATSAGATTFVVSSATGIAKGDRLYLRETGTPGNSEWCEVKDISGTTVTPANALTRAHTNGITITDFAERFSWSEDLSGIKRLRIVVDGGTNTSGQTVDVIAWMVSLDSVSTV